MKRSIAVVLCCLLLILSGCKQQQYKRISFSTEEPRESLKHIDEETKVEMVATGVSLTQIPIYEISERPITDEEVQIMQQQLGITDTLIEVDGNYINEIFGPRDGSFTMTDEELEKIAWETFEKLPFMDGTFEYLGITGRSERSDSEGTRVTSVLVTFRRTLGGIRVLGNEICWLGFNDDGLTQIFVRLYKYKEIGTMDVLSIDTVSESIKSPDRLVLSIPTMDGLGMFQTMQVEEVMPLLINQHFSKGCTILQPVYSFRGTAFDTEGINPEFNAWIIAIPDKYTYEE